MDLMHIKRLLRLYKTFIIQGIVTVAAVCAILFGVIPVAQKSMDMLGQVNTLSSNVSALQQKSSLLNGLDETTLQNDLAALAAAVPPDKSLPTVMSTLNNAASQSGVTIVDFELAKPGKLATGSAEQLTADEAKVGGYILPVSMTADGSLSQMQAFLQIVSGVRRYLRISTLSLSLYGSQAQAQFGLEAFYMPYPTSVGAVGQPITDLSASDKSVIARTLELPLFDQTAIAQPPTRGEPTGKADPFSH